MVYFINCFKKYFVVIILLLFYSSCGDVSDAEVLISIENSYKESGRAIDANGRDNASVGWDKIILNVELISFPQRIIYLQGVDDKIIWEGCTAKQRIKPPIEERIYNFFIKDRLFETVINYDEPGVQLINIKMNALTREDYNLNRSRYPDQWYTKNIIIPIQIISETFYDEVKKNLFNTNEDDEKIINEIIINIDEIINAVIIKYPSRIAYLQGLDTKLIWDDCIVEITTDDETLTIPIVNTGLLNLLETDVDFDEPGVYPVYIKGEGYELAFAVQVITEDFYQETLESLLEKS